MKGFAREELARQLTWVDLDLAHINALIKVARAEDLAGAGLLQVGLPPGDATSQLVAGAVDARFRVVSRFTGRVAGLPILRHVFALYAEGAKVEVRLHANDGDVVAPGTIVAEVAGPAHLLLQAERVALNFLQKLSGVATETAAYVAALDGSSTRLLDTRKTTPGWRMLEKYAVACGGGHNHRLGLFDRIMLKDNHLASLGATGGDRLTAAVQSARALRPDLAVEVEIDTLAQLEPVLAAGADVVMLDNFSDAEVAQAVAQTNGRAWLEASGGISIERVSSLAQTGVDFISTGATVHQSRWCDFGLDSP